jgi:hypothetical protein
LLSLGLKRTFFANLTFKEAKSALKDAKFASKDAKFDLKDAKFFKVFASNKQSINNNPRQTDDPN